ncbi:hypothetical protein DL96DRAFT_1535390 [Flagelloscypha sp. PMI_526]|nr:hypothetical protein DL96DRAFT_1535390 [Flagelloscypha sp. PMI_526]
MAGSTDEYTPLAPHDDGSLEDLAYGQRPKPSRSSLWRRVFYCVIILVQSSVLALLLLRPSGSCTKSCPARTFTNNPLVYSPIQDELEYEVKVFTPTLDVAWLGQLGKELPSETPSIYEGFTDEADEAWTNLYFGTFIKMTKAEASQLPNKTYPILGEEDAYIGQFDVFHQLHCLNYLRQSLEPDRYSHDSLHGLQKTHLEHCIESLRQSLTCMSDVSVVTFQWDEDIKQVTGQSSIAHSCRNFDQIQKWSRDRALDNMIDLNVKLDDGLPDIPIISG